MITLHERWALVANHEHRGWVREGAKCYVTHTGSCVGKKDTLKVFFPAKNRSMWTRLCRLRNFRIKRIYCFPDSHGFFASHETEQRAKDSMWFLNKGVNDV